MIPHLNRMPFSGVLTFVDRPSEESPVGARGHKILLSRDVVLRYLETLIGMGISFHIDGSHNEKTKIGVIMEARIEGDEVRVSGHIFAKNFPEIVKELQGDEDFGMSYELDDVGIEDMRTPIWVATKMTFTGACVMPRSKAACRKSSFSLDDGVALAASGKV